MCVDECFAGHVPGEMRHIKIKLPTRDGWPDRADERYRKAWEQLSLEDCGEDTESYLVAIARLATTKQMNEDNYQYLVRQSMDYISRSVPDVCIVDGGLVGGESMFLKALADTLFMPVFRFNTFAIPELWPPTPTVVEKLIEANVLTSIQQCIADNNEVFAQAGYTNGSNDVIPPTIFPTVRSLFYTPQGELQTPNRSQILCGPLVDCKKSLAEEAPELNAWIEADKRPVTSLAFRQFCMFFCFAFLFFLTFWDLNCRIRASEPVPREEI